MVKKMRHSDEFKKIVLEFLKTHTYGETMSKFQLKYITIHRWAKKIGYFKDSPQKSTICNCQYLTSEEKYLLLQLLLLENMTTFNALLAQNIIQKLHLK